MKIGVLCLLVVLLTGCGGANKELQLQVKEVQSQVKEMQVQIKLLEEEVSALKAKMLLIGSSANSGSWILWKRNITPYTGPGYALASPSTVVSAYSSKGDCMGAFSDNQNWEYYCLPKGVAAPFAR